LRAILAPHHGIVPPQPDFADPEPADRRDLLALTQLLFVAGLETTGDLIGDGVRLLLAYPGQKERARAGSGWPGASGGRTDFRCAAKKTYAILTPAGLLQIGGFSRWVTVLIGIRWHTAHPAYQNESCSHNELSLGNIKLPNRTTCMRMHSAVTNELPLSEPV
jgi:hypothetical protein